MYIGKLGDGSSHDDGIYVLFKEIMDNALDEHMMGFGKKIDVKLKDNRLEIRDYGRGIPLGKVIDCVSKINTGGKYDSEAFQKSVGLNGVGTKAVNALSSYFRVEAFREGKFKKAEFENGVLKEDHKIAGSEERDGTFVTFVTNNNTFKNYKYRHEFIEDQLWNYAYLNSGLTIYK